MKKEKCYKCGVELKHIGYPICRKCWEESLTPEDRKLLEDA